MQILKPVLVAQCIVDASDSVIDDFRNDVIPGEESMTDRLLGAISSKLDGRQFNGVTWKARTLKTARGRGAEEKRHGADVLGVLRVDLPDFKVAKGFLWQAKIVEPHTSVNRQKWANFQDQCRTMLSRTHESFAIIYSRSEGVRIIPAQLILEIDPDQIYEVGYRSMFGFFKSHIKCEIGDRRLDSPKIETLDRLINSSAPYAPDHPDAEHILSIKAHSE